MWSRPAAISASAGGKVTFVAFMVITFRIIQGDATSLPGKFPVYKKSKSQLTRMGTGFQGISQSREFPRYGVSRFSRISRASAIAS